MSLQPNHGGRNRFTVLTASGGHCLLPLRIAAMTREHAAIATAWPFVLDEKIRRRAIANRETAS